MKKCLSCQFLRDLIFPVSLPHKEQNGKELFFWAIPVTNCPHIGTFYMTYCDISREFFPHFPVMSAIPQNNAIAEANMPGTKMGSARNGGENTFSPADSLSIHRQYFFIRHICRGLKLTENVVWKHLHVPLLCTRNEPY